MSRSTRFKSGVFKYSGGDDLVLKGSLTVDKSFILKDADGSASVTLRAPATVTAAYSLTLPGDLPVSDSFVKVTSAGTLFFDAPASFTPSAHKTTHEPGGPDALTALTNTSIAAAAGIVESKLTLNFATHSNANDPTSGEKAALPGTSGTPGAANKYVTDADLRNTNARAPTVHATSHEDGGSDELLGNLDANARIGVRRNTGGSTFLRRRLNLLEGVNMLITLTDDAASEEVDVVFTPTDLWKLGGQFLGDEKSIGSADAQSFAIVTNGTIRATFTPNGALDLTQKGGSSFPSFRFGFGTFGNSLAFCHEWSFFDTFQTTNATTQNRSIYVVLPNKAVMVELYAVAYDQVDDNKAFCAIRRALFRRAGALVITQVGSTQSEYTESTDLACTVGFSTSSTTLRADITGVAGETLNWTVFAKITIAS